jgi:hypothetical protein
VAGQPPGEDLLGAGRHLCAEAAAHIGRDETDLTRLEAEEPLVGVAGALGGLRGEPDREALAVPCCRRAADLERGDADALVHEALGDNDLAAVEEVLVDRVAEAHRLLARMEKRHVDEVIVTTPEGRLLGVVRRL